MHEIYATQAVTLTSRFSYPPFTFLYVNLISLCNQFQNSYFLSCHRTKRDKTFMTFLARPFLNFPLFFLPLFLKVVCAVFYQIFIFNQMIALQKLWKMFFISSKKLFSFSRYSNFCISVFPSFSPLLAIALEFVWR